MTSTVITQYLGQGLAANRPATPVITAGAIALWYSTDTGAFSVYANGAWNNAGAAKTLIATQSPVGVGTVTFNALGAYKDLEIVVRGAGTNASTFSEVRMRFNGDTGSNYDVQSTLQNNATNTSNGAVAQDHIFCAWVPAASGVANAASPVTMYIADYAGTTFHKSALTQGGLRTGTGAGNMFTAQCFADWRNTAAITSITVYLDSGNFVTGSTISVYGIPA